MICKIYYFLSKNGGKILEKEIKRDWVIFASETGYIIMYNCHRSCSSTFYPEPNVGFPDSVKWKPGESKWEWFFFSIPTLFFLGLLKFGLYNVKEQLCVNYIQPKYNEMEIF